MGFLRCFSTQMASKVLAVSGLMLFTIQTVLSCLSMRCMVSLFFFQASQQSYTVFLNFYTPESTVVLISSQSNYSILYYQHTSSEMDSIRVKQVQQLEIVLLGQFGWPLGDVIGLCQNPYHLLPELRIGFVGSLGVLYLNLIVTPIVVLYLNLTLVDLFNLLSEALELVVEGFGVGAHQGEDLLLLEQGSQLLVFSNEADSQQPIPFKVVNLGRRVFGFDPDNTTFNFGWRLEVGLGYLHQVIHSRQQLYVHTQTTIQLTPWFCDHPLGKLLLEHQHGTPECRLVREEFEYQRGTDLVWDVGHTDIEEGQINSQHITGDERKLTRQLPVLEPFREFCHHPRIKFYCDDLFSPLQEKLSQVSRSRPYFQNNVCGLDGRLLYDVVEDVRIDQDVLAECLVEDHVVVADRRLHHFYTQQFLIQTILQLMAGRGMGTDIWVEADQKEIIISELKDQLYLLRKNEQDYLILQDQLTELERRYRLLHEEKALFDTDFRSKHEVSLRTIAQLKVETDGLKGELRERNLQLQDLQANGGTLKNQLDQRNMEIERLKNDTNSILDDNDQMVQEKNRIDSQLSGLKADKTTLLQSLKNLQNDNQNTKRKISELQKYQVGAEGQGKSLRDKILKYEHQNNALDGDINDIDAQIQEVSNITGETTTKVKELQHQIAGLQSENDKAKSATIHYQKAQQAEYFKNNDLAKTLVQAENALRNRQSQIVQGTQDIDHMLVECDKVGVLNGQLNQDMQALRRHLQNLGNQNSQLLLQIQRYSSEDQTVRTLIDRKPRVIRARMRVQESQTVSRGMVVQTGLQHSGILRRSTRLPI